MRRMARTIRHTNLAMEGDPSLGHLGPRVDVDGVIQSRSLERNTARRIGAADTDHWEVSWWQVTSSRASTRSRRS